MPRVMNELFFNLLSRAGQKEAWWAVRNRGLDWDLLVDIKDHTWFGIKFKLRKLFKR